MAGMNPDALFAALDLDGDGRLPRDQLTRAALEQGWHWREAPLFALLDLAAVREPLTAERFAALWRRLERDPRGPYGAVLEALPRPGAPRRAISGDVPAALLVIDPQRSFTEGAWMRSIGSRGAHEVAPIRRAFERCGTLLRAAWGQRSIAVTRCPFPPGSYGWDAAVADAIPPDAPYFIKPGNSALWPPTNGVAEWVAALLEAGIDTLQIAGCTLNSCVRVTAVALQQRFGRRGLQVVVGPDLTGARASNYAPSPEFGGRSSVETALEEMAAAGVRITAARGST